MTDEQKYKRGLMKAIKYYPQQALMLKAVASLLDWDSMNNICNHGINGGYHGFIYYSDTEAFARKHRKAIVSLIEHEAQEFGDEVEKFLSDFQCFDFKDRQEKKECMIYMYGGTTTKFETCCSIAILSHS